MRVLMLGWEFPPYISGGIGTACCGLTKALSHAGADIFFVLPQAVDNEHASHVRLLSPDRECLAVYRQVCESRLLEDQADLGDYAAASSACKQ
jgi:hypothetical protein